MPATIGAADVAKAKGRSACVTPHRSNHIVCHDRERHRTLAILAGRGHSVLDLAHAAVHNELCRAG
ncbi:hypothetical protein AWB67_06587 [Caballeronia terrestris]|uniref:Uncharacterized protein n=1 Tax=Caballeronia terrestris TaxID=1226301 RepID=A0A158KTM7_9BURK|nr:hypothetical protein AWB67_06587 [Caballeronia terrestris]